MNRQNMDATDLVEHVSNAFSCDWDKGTAENDQLAIAVNGVLKIAEGLQSNLHTKTLLLAVLIEGHMSLDTDEAGEERLQDIVREWLESEGEKP